MRGWRSLQEALLLSRLRRRGLTAVPVLEKAERPRRGWAAYLCSSSSSSLVIIFLYWFPLSFPGLYLKEKASPPAERTHSKSQLGCWARLQLQAPFPSKEGFPKNHLGRRGCPRFEEGQMGPTPTPGQLT